MPLHRPFPLLPLAGVPAQCGGHYQLGFQLILVHVRHAVYVLGVCTCRVQICLSATAGGRDGVRWHEPVATADGRDGLERACVGPATGASRLVCRAPQRVRRPPLTDGGRGGRRRSATSASGVGVDLSTAAATAAAAFGWSWRSRLVDDRAKRRHAVHPHPPGAL